MYLQGNRLLSFSAMFALAALIPLLLIYVTIVFIGSQECFEGTILGRVHSAFTDGLLDTVG